MYHIGVVGCGYWGPNLVRNLVENRLCRKVSFCDLEASKLEKLSLRYPAGIPHTHFPDMIAQPDLDGVMIATPLSTHFDLARRALLAGKHVFVEKPFTASSEQAEELISLAEQKKLALGVGRGGGRPARAGLQG